MPDDGKSNDIPSSTSSSSSSNDNNNDNNDNDEDDDELVAGPTAAQLAVLAAAAGAVDEGDTSSDDEDIVLGEGDDDEDEGVSSDEDGYQIWEFGNDGNAAPGVAVKPRAKTPSEAKTEAKEKKTKGTNATTTASTSTPSAAAAPKTDLFSFGSFAAVDINDFSLPDTKVEASAINNTINDNIDVDGKADEFDPLPEDGHDSDPSASFSAADRARMKKGVR
jgi:hypothetical protein